MEFPKIGTRCSLKECRQLDFLPFICSNCSYIFCKTHFHITSHSCSNSNNNTVAAEKKKIVTVNCSEKLCIDKSLIKILCTQCNKHYCFLHRIHQCFEKNEEKKIDVFEKWEKSKKEFLEAKSAIDQQITINLKKCSNFEMSYKVQLMRLKGKSIGPDYVPTTERCYFLVHAPINNSIKMFVGSKGVYISINWSIGKVIDSIANSLNIPNFNNLKHMSKLNMFHYLTGNIVTNKMDIILSELLNINNLVNGQDVILEYTNSNKIDCLLYK